MDLHHSLVPLHQPSPRNMVWLSFLILAPNQLQAINCERTLDLGMPLYPSTPCRRCSDAAPCTTVLPNRPLAVSPTKGFFTIHRFLPTRHDLIWRLCLNHRIGSPGNIHVESILVSWRVRLLAWIERKLPLDEWWSPFWQLWHLLHVADHSVLLSFVIK